MIKRQPRAGADRWLVSYADFTTLLLAFFMALYAASDVNPGKLATVASSLQEAFDTPPTPEGTGVLPGSKDLGRRAVQPIQLTSVLPGSLLVRGSASSAP